MAKKQQNTELSEIQKERSEASSLVTMKPQSAEKSFNMLMDPESFAHLWKVATCFSRATLVPSHYQGENGVANCVIALQMAMRLGIEPMTFLQKSYIVHGKPGIEAVLVLALLNRNAPIKGFIEFEFTGGPDESPKNDDYGCHCVCTHQNGKKIIGPKVDWRMVKAEGWLQKTGSKWATIPSMMFRYRAASFLGRLYFPEVLLGMQTREELEDAMTVEGTIAPSNMADLTTELLESAPRLEEPAPPADAESAVPDPEPEPEKKKRKPRKTKAQKEAEKKAKEEAKAKGPQDATMPTQADEDEGSMPDAATEAPDGADAPESASEPPKTDPKEPPIEGLKEDESLFVKHMDNKMASSPDMDGIWTAYEDGRNWWGVKEKKAFSPELEKALKVLLDRYKAKFS